MGDISALARLKQHLAQLPPGEVAQEDSLTTLLVDCWYQFEGASAAGMGHPSLRVWRRCAGRRP